MNSGPDPSSYGILLFIVLMCTVIGLRNRRAQSEIDYAATYYYTLLDHLKRSPADPDLYQETLGAGRAYSNLTRDKKGVTIYDEVALSNDLNAARAGVTQMAKHTAPVHVSAIDRVKQLDALKSQAMITDQEYAEKRAEILRSL